jgi:hypothetical protein
MAYIDIPKSLMERIRALEQAEASLTSDIKTYFADLFETAQERLEKEFLRLFAKNTNEQKVSIWDGVKALQQNTTSMLADTYDEAIDAGVEEWAATMDGELPEAFEEGYLTSLWELTGQGMSHAQALAVLGMLPDDEVVLNDLGLMGYEGVPYKDRADRWGKDAKPRLRQWLLASALGGLTLDQTVQGVSGITGTLGGRLAALGEDEYHGGFMYGTAQAIRQANNGFMYGADRPVDIKQWYPISEVWLTKEDELVCAVCYVKHLSITMEIPRVHTHPNCVLGDTRVGHAAVRGATKRLYKGLVVTVKTAGGQQLSVTPNHPVLTPSGWQPAGALREGDQVICCGGEQRVRLSGHHHDVEMPALVSEVFVAVSRTLGVAAEEVEQAPEHFHGDGTKGEITQVATYGDLNGNGFSTLLKKLRQKTLCWAGKAYVPSLGLLASRKLLLTPSGAAHGGVGVGHLVPSLEGRHRNPFGRFLLRLGSHHTELPESGRERLPMNPEVSRQLEDRYPGLITADHITHVEQHFAVCHVYNLQTEQGWYSSNGIVTHNCRCWKVPITLDPHRPMVNFQANPVSWVDFLQSIGKR